MTKAVTQASRVIDCNMATRNKSHQTRPYVTTREMWERIPPRGRVTFCHGTGLSPRDVPRRTACQGASAQAPTSAQVVWFYFCVYLLVSMILRVLQRASCDQKPRTCALHDVTPRKCAFVTLVGQRSSPWLCKLGDNFPSRVSSVFLVHNLCCSKCIELTYQ